MINNEELPIGFTMELAQHSDVLNRFSSLPETEQRKVIDGARDIKSRSEMRHYVESIFKGSAAKSGSYPMPILNSKL